ncbi:cytosolic arginine sensor for mTORC1 subunit 1 isoform X1 [Larus michahellis]|uniref:cytosolic arginine sensor for mTORC1 subunit 1 isoform X1 n=1 Tax=Larus michahellis TaxID=119627 RepID=UPI003D9AC20E
MHPGLVGGGGRSLGPAHPCSQNQAPSQRLEQLSPVWLVPPVEGAGLCPQTSICSPRLGLILSWLRWASSSPEGQCDTRCLSRCEPWGMWHRVPFGCAKPQGAPCLSFPLPLAELPPSEFMQVADSTWLVLSVVSNGRAPSGCQATGVTKIARSVIAPLAEHHVSVLMLSTYQTDFILVRERDLPVVIHTLAGEFDIYKEESGECVPVTCDDVSNGFLKPKPAASPTLHPVQSPQTRFCVLTVAPDTLPAIATMLIDVLFYSHSPPREAGADGQDLDSITFFAFSLIEGYISIVMDAETQKRFPSDLLLTSSTGELWRMVRIGGQPLGFDECGIVAQIAEPLAAADISAYYISTFNFDHALVPEEGIAEVIQLLQQRQESGR